MVHSELSLLVFSQMVQVTEWKGLLVGGGFHGFGVQFIGMIITIAWVAVTMTIIFQAIKHTVGLRVTAEEEIEGLDSKEHGLTSAYDGFVVHDTMTVPTPMGVAKKICFFKYFRKCCTC